MKEKILKFICNKKNIPYIIFSILFIVIFLSASVFSLSKLSGSVVNFSISSLDNRASFTMENTIENYNSGTKFLYSDTKKIKINANFNGEYNTNKKIIIILKEGLSYLSYPVLVDDKKNPFDIEMKLESYLRTAVKNVEVPELSDMGNISEHNKELGQVSYGELTYYINDNISSVELEINIKGDAARFYGEKEISDAISVQVIETDVETNNQISSNISANITLLAKDNFKIEYSSHDQKVTKEVIVSTPNYTSYGYTKIGLVSKYQDNSSYSITRGYYKEIEYHLYYPEYTQFVDIFQSSGDGLQDKKDVTFTNDSLNHKVIIKAKWPFSTHSGFGVKYKVNQDAPVGETVVFPEKNKIVVTYYDNSKKEYMQTEHQTVKFLEVNSFENKLNLSVTNYYDDEDDETFVYGPMFVISNKTLGTKTNQTLEFNIEPNYQAIKINFPYDKKKATVSDIKYKTNLNNDWINYTQENFNGTLAKTDAGLKKEEYFIAAKLTVSSYEEGYKSAGSPVIYDNAVVYGNLKKGTDSAIVKFRTYEADEKGNPIENTLSEINDATITHPKQKTFLVSKNTNTYYYYKSNKEIVHTGEEFTINGTIEAHLYPIETINHVKDIKIYLRQPEGTTINPDTIKLTDKNNASVNYKKDKKKNVHGETIYILSTTYDVGRYFTENLIENKLKINYNIKVNLDFSAPEINIKDLITFGSAEDFSVLTSSPAYDINDINANGKTDDKIANVGDAKIRVLADEQLAVSTYVEKDGIISSPYDENNVTTIMELHQKEQFNYKVKIKNNYDYKINGFELYLPIPKKSVNFGEKFQPNSFYWNISLNGNISINGNTTIPNGYSILYTTDVPTNENDYKNLSFSKDIPSNINNITMIKIVTSNVIDVSETIDISIPLRIDESREYLSNSVNKINVWNPVYYINTDKVKGMFKGTGVGVKLLNHEINGKIFYDNNGNGLYDENIDLLSSDAKVNLYKLNSVTNKYELLQDAKVSYDNVKKEFYFDDYNTLKNSNLALKFNVPKGYFVSTTNSKEENVSKASKDGWITNINIDSASNLNIGFVKYELDFSVDDIILLEGETGESTLKISSPTFFEYVKNENIAYKWELINIEDQKYVTLENNNLPYTKITGILKNNKVKAKVTIYDKYDNSLSKEFNIKVVNDASPTLIAENVTINVGEKIEFEKYVKKAYDYKENEIELIWNGKNKNISYTSVIPNDNNIGTKAGAYEVTYLLEHDGRVAIKTIKIIVDDKFGLLNPQTQDKISIVITLLVFVVSTLFILKKLD